IGARHGLDSAVMNDVLNASTGGSWVTRNHVAQRVLSGRFDDPFRLELMVKDIGIALSLARDADLPLPASALGDELWRAALEAFGAGGNVSDLFRWVEQRTRTRIAPRAAG
ncbi:MAG: NAD-binding protein, partial [Burkholderiales bacterium]|nr:NAD-binding protein [Burkholderiales bacterium]